MGTLFTILTICIVVASILLVLVVLLQNGKGDGLASNFVAANQTLGVRQAADILEKMSWGLVTFILVLSIVTSIATSGSKKSDIDVTDQIQTEAVQQPEFPGIQNQGAADQAAPAQEAPATEAPAQN